jgi:putative ABC transport system permease protein
MIKKDIVFAFRNLWRNKLIAGINVLGLTIGISACLVIFLIANYELGFDKFHADRDRIFRVYSHFSGSFTANNRGVPTGFAAAIKDEFTGIDAVCNFQTFGANVQVPDGKAGKKYFEQYGKIILTAPVYFTIFDHYEWLEGSPDRSLGAPRQVVLTASRAKIYFGDLPFEQVIGREINYRDSLAVTVSGIVRDVEERTDFDFTDFISINTVENSWLKKNIRLDDWNSTNSSSQLFIKASAGTPRSKLEEQISLLANRYAEKNKDAAWRITPQLQPLDELHFNTELGIFDNSRSVVEKSTLQVLIAIALLLLVIASINFINLETAQASRRAKEVGVRKVLGSSRKKLIAQFLLESFILTFLAVISSLALAWVAIRYFKDFIPPGLTLRINEPFVIIFLVACLFTVTFLAGLYPAFVLSSCQPALALKNLASFSRNATRSSFIRKGLTVFQFSFSQILIIATLAIGLQINFMLNKDLGFSSDAIVYFDTPWWEDSGKRFALKNELEQIPEIKTLSLHNDPPSSNGWSSSTFEYDNGKEIVKHNVYHKQGDSAYLKLYDIQLIAGRNLQPSDTAIEYLINETYMKQLGFTDPRDVLGKVVNKKPVVGVFRDFHSRSLHTAIDPMAIYNWEENYTCFGMKLHAQNNKVTDLQPAIDKIEAAWKKIYPDQKFKYSFMDDTIKRFYETEQRTGKLARVATVIAVLISCLGLFGLSSFTVIQRTKEIGIRKVLGATVNSIRMLLSKDFLKLVIVAFILSAPVAYYVTDLWLQEFAYRTEFGAWLFLAAGLASLVTAFLTISIRTVGAAKADPVKSLKYE